MSRCIRCAIPVLLAVGLAPTVHAGGLKLGAAVSATVGADADAWGGRIEELIARGELSVSRVQPDPHLPGRQHVRYDQRLRGLRVFGHQLVRQLDERGRTLTVFGRFAEPLALDAQPRISEAQAVRAAEAHRGRGSLAVGPVELVVLPLEERTLLAYTLWVRFDQRLDRYFIDAHSGAVAYRYSDHRSDSQVGLGTGVWDDRKKVSADRVGGSFRADDKLRPPVLKTFDMQFNLGALILFLNTGVVDDSFVAADSDNTWTDGGIVDAHAYAGFTYDYYFKRHNRRGIDGNDIPIQSFNHFLRGFDNAFWDPFVTSMFYGDGGAFANFAGALDVVAHELTHGVTQFSWNGIYQRESGALNEAFSDIMGASVENQFEPVGNARKQADWFIGEDLAFGFNPPRTALRSMENPSLFCHGSLGCDPDHYSRRLDPPACSDENDNCGVHINSGIANQAFYLLIEGGTNRTSGIRVAGLGFANRDRAERIFYRGFTAFLTPSASFADARRATIQAAQELFGAGSNEVGQTGAAWTAVGVN